MSYTVRKVMLRDVLDAMLPIYRQHYVEMEKRLLGLGVEVSPFKPRIEQYVRASDEGWLVAFVLEHDGEPVGYVNAYVTNDMHNGDLIAQEDAIYVLPEHRRGAGRLLSKALHDELRRRGVKRLNITTGTDLRVAKWLERQGYKHTAHCMTLTL